MPTYDYQCDACDHTFEEFQSFSDEPLKKCPACKKNKLRRLLGTGAAVIFKGSGFYQTDYRSDSYKSAAKADQAPAATDNGGGKTGGESKAEPTGTTESAPAKSAGKKAKS